MENGIAFISNGIGKISTEQPPTTVKFDASTFGHTVRNNMPVRFERLRGSEWATWVEPLQEVLQLMRLAGPPETMTRQAHVHLLTRATEFVAASRAASTEADRHKLMKRAEAAISAITQLSPGSNSRIGLVAIRKTLNKT